MPAHHHQASRKAGGMTAISYSEPLSTTASAQLKSRVDARVPALDGLRGLATLMVVFSHFFGEVDHGITAFMVGWIAVTIFFTLSGYLVGKLILERKHSTNFFTVFYVRRICRTVPSYMLVTLMVYAMFAMVNPPKVWMQFEAGFPLWSYLTFTQNFLMAFSNEVGPHWLGPLWTLALEEHFYLLGPALLVFTPKRWIVPVLITIAIAAIGFREAAITTAPRTMIALLLLPSRMDTLIMGILAAVLVTRSNTDWTKIDRWLRIIPLVSFVLTFTLRVIDEHLMLVFSPFILGFGSAAFILMLLRGLPEAARFNSKFLIFFADTSYAIYLTHLSVLASMHGLFLGTAPDIQTVPQIAVTIAALPVTVVVGWLLTRLVEIPITAYGRSWKWREPVVQTA